MKQAVPLRPIEILGMPQKETPDSSLHVDDNKISQPLRGLKDPDILYPNFHPQNNEEQVVVEFEALF